MEHADAAFHRYDSYKTAQDYHPENYLHRRSNAGRREHAANLRYSAMRTARQRPAARASRRGRARAGAFIALIALIGAAVVFSLATKGVAPVSTPQSEWEKGVMPYLYQTDASWADAPYAEDTIGISGCGPVCLSMVYVTLTGSAEYGPVEMARFSEENGYVIDGATAWALMTQGADRLGIEGREIPADAAIVEEELAKGHPIICSMRPGDFTTTGHFIVLSGIDASGKVDVHDPNSVGNSSKSWDVDTILEQCKGMWAFSA